MDLLLQGGNEGIHVGELGELLDINLATRTVQTTRAEDLERATVGYTANSKQYFSMTTGRTCAEEGVTTFTASIENHLYM